MNHRTTNKAFWWKLSLLVLAVLLNFALASRIVWGSHSLYTNTRSSVAGTLAGALRAR